METIFEKVVNKYYCTTYKDHCVLHNPKTEELFGEPPQQFAPIKILNQWFQDQILNDSEQDYVKNYANMLAAVSHRRDIVTIVKDDKKITLKKFTYSKGRNRGAKFFRKQTGLYYISYNFEKNNLYYGFINNYHLKRKSVKSIKQDSFGSNFFLKIYSQLRSDFYSCFDKEFNTNGLVDEIVDIFLSEIIKSNEYDNLPRTLRLKKFMLDKKGYKLPNNWESFIDCFPQPKMKEIRKHGMKYIDSFMEKNNLNGDKIKKVLHISNRIDVANLHRMFDIFGKDFLLGKSLDDLVKIISSSVNFGGLECGLYKKFINQSNKCKNNLYKLILLCSDGIINIWTLNDHLRMYFKLIKFEPVKWTANCLDSFNSEHIDYTEKLQKYTVGDRYRIYGDKFVELLEKPILFENKTYYPCVLKSFLEYADESLIQSNCVRSYIDRESSLIVSLREDSKNGKARASIEYRIGENEKNKNITLKRVQTLGKFNAALDKEWKTPIEDLDTRILFISKFFELPKLRIVTNFKEYVIESKFFDDISHNGLKWDHTEETGLLFQNNHMLIV